MQLGPYTLVGELGRGGQAAVFRARAPDGRDVALKLFHAVRTPEERARFDRERRLLASLGEDDGFVPLLDAGESPRGFYLVMPFLAGGTLRARLRRGPLGLEETLGLAVALANALGRAHALGIVHRDLKPENVLFTGTGDPRVADLGLAKHFRKDVAGASQSASLSRAGATRGTAGYMAPEQLRNARDAGPACDVFALGAILYECLAGSPVFEAASTLELLVALERCEPEPLARRAPEVPRWLATVVERALARDPADRFEDGAALARALIAGEAHATGGRRGLEIVALVALVLALGGGGALFARALTRKAPPTPAPAPSPAPTTAPTLASPSPVAAKPSPDAAKPSPAPTESAVALAREGALHFDAGDLEAAARAADRALALDPHLGEAWNLSGMIALTRRDVASALAAFEKAVELAPANAHAWSNRGVARARTGDLAGAIADYTRALDLDPRLVEAAFSRGNARARLHDPDGAIADFDRAVAIDPGYVAAYANRALAREAKGDLAGALPDYDAVVRLAPRDARVWAQRGLAYVRRNQPERALPDLDRALALDPRSASAYRGRALVLAAQGKTRAAIADAEQALALTTDESLAAALRETLVDLRKKAGE